MQGVVSHAPQCCRSAPASSPSPQDSWEIVEGLRGTLEIVQEPPKQEGLLLKKRKWPMKGWHKVGSHATDLEAPLELSRRIRAVLPTSGQSKAEGRGSKASLCL